MDRYVVTLGRFIIESERRHRGATGALSNILYDLTLAAKLIHREVSKAGLVDILGMAGKENVHGEEVRKLDEYAHDVMFNAMDHNGQLCVMASEEEEGPDPDSGQVPDRRLRATVRSARRQLEYRCQHLHRHDLFHPPPDQRGPGWDAGRLPAGLATGRWPPATSCTGPPPFSCTRRDREWPASPSIRRSGSFCFHTRDIRIPRARQEDLQRQRGQLRSLERRTEEARGLLPGR